ncbi:MAG: TadE family protein [Dermatophilaceae bacterium]
MRLRPGRDSRDLGAAAVEFALVVPLLLLLVFGIVDYGRFFFDSVSLRQGAREAARQAVVQQYGACTGSNVGNKIACSARAASDSTMGTGLKVYIPEVTWKQGNQLLVCMQSREQGTGFVPLPGGGMGYGILKTKVYMSIEKDRPPVLTSDTGHIGEGIPTGGDPWSSWCS